MARTARLLYRLATKTGHCDSIAFRMRTLFSVALVVFTAALAWPRAISQPGLTAEYRIATAV